MDPYAFLKNIDSRNAFIDGMNPLSNLSGLNLTLPPGTDIRGKTRIAREEAALEAKVVQIIASGDWASLKPNSGKAISIGDHNICVSSREDADTGYRIWEWHGHLLLFDDEEGFTLEYVYGNHFQPLEKKAKDGDEGSSAAVGLGGLIYGDDKKQQGSIIHRGMKKEVLPAAAVKK